MELLAEYRGFRIYVDLVRAAQDMFNAYFQIQGPLSPAGVPGIGRPMSVRSGPVSRRLAYFIAEVAGRLTVDGILDGPAARGQAPGATHGTAQPRGRRHRSA